MPKSAGAKAQYARAMDHLRTLKATKAVAVTTHPAVDSASPERSQIEPEGLTPSTVEPAQARAANGPSRGGEFERDWGAKFAEFKEKTVYWIVGTGIGTVLAIAGIVWGMLTFALGATQTATSSIRDETLRSTERAEKRLDGVESRLGEVERRMPAKR